MFLMTLGGERRERGVEGKKLGGMVGGGLRFIVRQVIYPNSAAPRLCQ